MKRPQQMINANAMARRIDVDNRISLRYYYRIADNILRQACIYREEKNIVDLYIILLRFSSLLSETIPLHRDYKDVLHKEKLKYKKKLVAVLSELEVLQPEFRRQANELNKYSAEIRANELNKYSAESRANDTWLLEQDAGGKSSFSAPVMQGWRSQLLQDGHGSTDLLSTRTTNISRQLQNLSFSIPVPKEETLSRHSFLGPNGLRGNWSFPASEIKVHYPSKDILHLTEGSSLNQDGAYHIVEEKIGDAKETSIMDAVLSLDDSWRRTEDSHHLDVDTVEDNSLTNIAKQPLPPPVLAQLHPAVRSISPSKVADPRPGPAKSMPDSTSGSSTYQHLHVPVKMMDDFLKLARENTAKNLETCGVLAGSLQNRIFHITALIIPKQESTPDTCQTLNEEEIFEIQDKFSLFPLGWIHTHPSQSCFMSSVDLHTHYSYQIMLPEAVAIVMAPTDIASPHGIFHLSDPSGVSVVRNCQQRGFHPHEEPEDGHPIYEHCSHVYMNANLKCEIIDLR